LRTFLVIVLPKQYLPEQRTAWVAEKMSKDKQTIEAQTQIDEIRQQLLAMK
jgi:hypothetical protein